MKQKEDNGTDKKRYNKAKQLSEISDLQVWDISTRVPISF
jgi:hypothetical protein